MLLSAIAAARARNDDEWLRAVGRCVRAINEAVGEALGNPLEFQEVPLPGAANNGFETMGHLLMKFGTLTGDKTLIGNGIRLAKYYVSQVFERRNGTWMDRRSWIVYSESLHGVPAMYWLTRHTGEQSYADTATELVQTAIERTQRADGLWHHFKSLKDGSLGACWSRGQLWPVAAMTHALEALGPQAPAGEFMRRSVRRTFAALEKCQDPDWGLWHLVADEPESRIESSATAGLLYCHDRLREMGVLDDRYEAMTHRALVGLKRLYYRGGLGASCRGTACGDRNYYRSRPQGYQLRTHLPAALAARVR
jgi:rhamnogalacturonyl hydrolase YesR